MARGKQVVYSSSSTDDIEVSEDVEVSEEERSFYPQLVRRLLGQVTSRSAKAIVFDSARFTTLRNQEWHEEYAIWSSFSEMHVSPEIETVYHLSEAFNQLRWAPILTLSTHYHSYLVREFYANIESKEHHRGEILGSWMDGGGLTVWM